MAPTCYKLNGYALDFTDDAVLNALRETCALDPVLENEGTVSATQVSLTFQEMPPQKPDWGELNFSLKGECGGFNFDYGNICVGEYVEKENQLKIHVPHADSSLYPADYLERAVQACFRFFCVSNSILSKRSIYVHSALGIFEGQGILFPATSGTGKSTLSQDFRRVYAQADDVAIIHLTGGGEPHTVAPCATRKKTWSNVMMPQRAHLSAIAFLEQGDEKTEIVEIAPKEACSRMLGQVIEYSNHPQLLEFLLERVSQLTQQLPCFVVKRVLGHQSADDIFFKIQEKAAQTC